MTVLAHFLAHCCLHCDASGADNGITRHIITYFGGFYEGNAKNPIALIGMPSYGKNDCSLPVGMFTIAAVVIARSFI
jgi:hypothetical protein